MLTQETIMQVATSEANAGDFPKVVQGFKAAGVVKYDYLVEPGMYVFWDEEGAKVEAQLNGIPKSVGSVSSEQGIKDAVKQAQSGKIDFEQFCGLAGAAGVPVWHSDLIEMVVTYEDGDGKVLLQEPIPSK
ncbi:hypothetical protein PWEIH_07416 [Listeria weihenstephanensis FSL R9-0317]|uniref:DUF1398 family protein n=1 Tax=Listeria weihenstephanensis TaxID=1006155 RepID=A0A1S7FXS0_9LIST|nr:DUF1398 family protein [Listeria weihenstephanensis]AQY52218.1 phage envelope protein [Listeria weihenstephanensis]EUJ39512.1 hypothetical protein PWEIH_07416 [Listeria weihenstephanensis FSL R9-0317]MBC1500186.1 DUF1398 family protein [Listeria weihenstephanensis]